MATYSIKDQLQSAWTAIEGALNDPEIMKALKPLGYDNKEMNKGKALCQDAFGIQNAYKAKYGKQRQSTDHLHTARSEAYNQYMEHLQLARMVVPRDRDRYLLLQLKGPRNRTFTGWLSQARAFYQNIDLVAADLERRGVTREELEQAGASVEAVAAARVQQNACKSKAQQSKEERDAVLEALHVWMTDFLRAARYAFAKNPQQLEALGLVVR